MMETSCLNAGAFCGDSSSFVIDWENVVPGVMVAAVILAVILIRYRRR